MAKLITLPAVIQSDAKIVLDELTLDRAFPNLGDGLHKVQRSIVHCMYNDYKDSNSVKATALPSTVAEKYHLHGDKSIHRSCLMMTGERLPLLTAVQQNGKGFSTRNSIPQERYITYYKTKWGEILNKSLINAKMVTTHSSTDQLPDFYPTMFPYLLFTYYANINKGVTTMNVPMCPDEIFTMLKMLLRNINTPFEDLLKVFKGADLGENFTIATHPQSLYTLLKDGYGKFDVLANIEFTRDTILFKEIPYRTTLYKFMKLLESTTFEHIMLSGIEMMTSKSCLMRCRYRLAPGSTLAQAQKELYEKTSLRKTIAVEIVGFRPNNESDPYAGKLDIIGIRDLLLQCLHYGYQERKKDLELQIEAIYKKVEFNSLLERLTRPETLEWFEPLQNTKNREADLFRLGNERITEKQYGKYIVVKGGITQEEIKEVFKRKGNDILGDLDSHPRIEFELNQLSKQLEDLYAKLEPDNIINYLEEVIDDWLKDPICKRMSNVGFSNINSAITSKSEQLEQLLVQHIAMTKANVNVPVNLIFYKDGKIDYWNPKTSLDIPTELMSHDIYAILKCTTEDTLVTMWNNRRHKIPVRSIINNLQEYNSMYKESSQKFIGVMIYEWEKVYPDNKEVMFIVTKRGKVKKIKAEYLLQYHESVKPLPLNNGDSILYAKLTTDEELNKYVMQISTSRGVKRKSLSEVPVRNLNGTNSLLSYTSNIEVYDFDFIPIEQKDTIKIYANEEFKTTQVDMSVAYKRDIYKELVLTEDGIYKYSLAGKEYYNLDGKLLDIKELFHIENESDLLNTLGEEPTEFVGVRVLQSVNRTQYKEV